MTTHQILGQDVDLDDDLTTPIDVCIVVKALDRGGQVQIYAGASGSFTAAEALGMFRYGELLVERSMWEDDDDE